MSKQAKPTRMERQLKRQNEQLRLRLEEAEDTIRAIREGEVDAVVVSGSKGEQVFSLVGSESIYRLIVQTMKEAAFTIAFDGTILFCNEQFSQLVKWPMEQIVGRPLKDFVTDKARSAASSMILLAQRQPVRQRLVLQSSEGSAVPVHAAAHVLNQPDGISVCVVASDLTELENSTELIQQLRSQQDELRRTGQELQRSNRDLEQFAYIASHDLQEPLRMVASFLSLLKERYNGKFDKDGDQFIDYAVDGARRMQGMIRDLLQYSRAGSDGMRRDPVNLNGVLEYVKTNLKPAIEESAAVITYDPLPTVPGDDAQLRQIFQNLIGNALKFRSDARRPKVHISACLQKDAWLFEVSDNGIGIDAAKADRLFQVFQRLHSHDEYEGTGIGLAICKKIVERRGGRIWFESSPGNGTKFYFTWPE